MHATAFPLIAEGVEGVVPAVTESVRAAEAPQLLFAVTEIVPPDEDGVAAIVLIADVPDHPEGNVHV